MPESQIVETDLRPIVPYLGRDAAGDPRLIGAKCRACGEIALGEVAICPSCGGRGTLETVTLATTGRLYNYTTVHRSLPGVPTPFVFAVVDLDGGGVVKGNLVAPAEALAFDMPVKVVFGPTDRRDAKGRAYLTYHFVQA